MRGRKKKIEKIWSIIKSYVIMIVACILLLFIKEHILALLDKVVSWLHLCSKEWFAVIITTAGIVFSILIIYEIHKKKRQVANSTLATVLFIIVVYSFFRFIDNTYLFWGLDYYKWCDIIYIPFILLILQKIVCRRPPKDINNTCIHIVDKPIERAEDDRFYYDWMSKGLLSDLETVDVKERSYSVGVLGIWGQGKSSFLNLFKRHAIKNQDIVVEFYPRASKSINNIQEDYFIALKESLKKYHTGIGRYISNYARAVADVDEGWIGKIVLALSIYSKEKEKGRVNSIIKSIGKRIFVIIEDLDRLTGEEIIEVLKLLERNGDFCNTVYLTAYDKKYINEVIGKYLQYSRSQDYTDKYFDYEYSLPKNSEQVLYSFAIQYLTDKVIFQQEDKNYKQDLLNSWESIGQLVVNNLETMRHVKRYLNIFMSRYPKVKNDVDLTDFLLLTLLRYKDLAAYNAIFELRFIRRGSISEGKQKMLYLRTDYEAILKELNIHSSSKKIIELLFHKSEDMHGTTLKEVYSKLEWVESFNSYFFDYRVGKYHYEDYLELFKADEPVAFSTIETMQKDGISVQLTDFLKSRRENWVIDEAGLSRLFKIFIYLNSIARTLDLDFLIDGFMTTETMNEYLKARVVKDKKSYIETIDKAITEMSSVCPIEVNYSCQRNIEDIYDGQTNNSFIYTQDKLIEWAVAAQKCYYHRFPNDGYDINVLINLANVKELKNNQLVLSDSSKKELVSLMKSYPEQFAKEIVAINSFVVANTKRVIGVSFIKGFEYEVLLNVDGFSFEDWIHTINDKKMSYVLQRIYAQRNNNGLQVPALKEKYENGDFAGLYEAIRANEIEEDDKKVLFIISRYLSLDYGTIQELTGIEINRVKASITRLVNEKKIDKKYATMKERMEPFEKGDYVKLIDESYNTYAKNLYYSSNIFEIDGIQKDGTYKLSDIEISVPRKDIEAIPIDGKHDRNIYYNPPVISIDHSTPLPHVDEDEYYLNSLKTDIMSEGKTLKNIVEENDCQYLHEVQHCLRRLNNNVDNLYLNKTI